MHVAAFVIDGDDERVTLSSRICGIYRVGNKLGYIIVIHYIRWHIYLRLHTYAYYSIISLVVGFLERKGKRCMEEVDHHAALLNVNLSGVVARFVSKSCRTGVCPLLLLFVPHAGCNLRSMHAMRGVRVLACCSTRKRSTRFVVRHNGQKLYPSKDSNLLCSAGNQ